MHGTYLECLARISSELVAAADLWTVLPRTIQQLRNVTGTCRCYYLDYFLSPEGSPRVHLRSLAQSEALAKRGTGAGKSIVDYAAPRLKRWREELSQGQAVSGYWGDFPAEETAALAHLGSGWLTALPIRCHGRLRGILGAEVSHGAQPLGTDEIHLLRAAANLYSSALERQAIEQDLQESQRLLLESQRLESVGMLAGGIAHDFNNILMGILGYAGLVKDALTTDHPAYPLIQTIEQSSERAAALTKELLAYARGGKLKSVPLRLDEQVNELVNILRTNLPREIEIIREFEEYLPYVTADPAQLQQVIMNLCINAGDAIGPRLKAAADGYRGVLRLATRTHRQPAPGAAGAPTFSTGLSGQPPAAFSGAPELAAGNYVVLTVTDNGLGMSQATLNRIFEPFFTTKFTGRGLGLSAVLGIVDNHGGGMCVESTPGLGTTFSVYLPQCCDLPELDLSQEDFGLGGAETILVVDDQEVVRQMALLTLTNLGYNVLLANSPQEGLAVYQEHQTTVALIVVDLNVSEVSSRPDLIKLLEHHPQSPVLLTSGYDEATALEAAQINFRPGFLQKPYTSEVLGRAVRRMLDETRP